MTAASKKTSRLVNFAYLSFMLAWSLGIIFLIGKQFALNTLFCSSNASAVFINDFLHFYCAGQLVLQGQAAHVYAPQVQMQFMERLIAPLHAAQVFYIQYVPFVFPLSAPLALLPVKASYLIWTAISTGCILASLALMHRFVPRFGSIGKASIVYLGLFATLSNYECLELGQLGNLLLLLVSVYFIAIARSSDNEKQSGTSARGTVGTDIVGGLCLALSSFKPHYAIMLAVPALALKRWRLLAAATLSESILLIFSGLVLGFNNILNYPHVVLEADSNPQYGGVHAEHMVSIRGQLIHFMSDPLSLKVSLILFLLSAGCLFWLWSKKAKSLEGISRCFALTVTIILVLSPHTNLYDCVLLVLPAYLLLPGTNLLHMGNTTQSSSKVINWLLALYPLFSAVLFVLWEYLPLPWLTQNPLPFFIMHSVLLVSIALRIKSARDVD